MVSSLLPVYHASANFLPLSQAALPATVDPILAPLDGNSTHQPRPSQLGPLIEAQGMVAASRHHARWTTTLAEVGNSAHTSYSFTSQPAIGDAPLRNSWLQVARTGKEDALVARIRRAADALHGTVAGGQAGLLTVEELGQLAVEEDKQRKLERTAEEEEASRQELLDARLESEYREDADVRA